MKATGKGYNACGLLPIFWPTFQMVAMDVNVKTSLFEQEKEVNPKLENDEKDEKDENVDIYSSNFGINSTRFIDKNG